MKKTVLGILFVAVLATVPIVAFAVETELPTIAELAASITGLSERMEALKARVKQLEELETRVEKLEAMLPPTPTPTMTTLTPTPTPTITSLTAAPTPTATPTVTPTPLRVSAKKILDDYERNTAAAKETYENVFLEVTGRIEKIDEDGGEYYIVFDTGAFIDNFRCNLAPDPEDTWRSLGKGNNIVVHGWGAGRYLEIFDFNLDDCTIIE